MFKHLLPDARFSSFDEVTPELLSRMGVKLLLCDIDNTLAPYEEPDPSPAVLAWAQALREAGVTLVLISNNHRERVERFSSPLAVPAYHDFRKPAPRALGRLIADGGYSRPEAAVLGDQIFTDVWEAKAIGVRALLVPPIRDKKTLFFRFKRLLEKPILCYYDKHHGGAL